jgi:hypothetical protein
MKKEYKPVLLAVLLLAAGIRLAAIENATLFRVFLKDGTAVVSFGELARVGDRVVFSMPIGATGSGTSELPVLLVVNIPADTVDWVATAKYTESVRFAHYAATSAEADYAALTGEVAGVLNSIMFTKDRQARLDLATLARRRLASWPQDHFGYRAADVRQVLGLLDEVISDLRASAGQTDFTLDLVATVDPPALSPPLPEPSAAESIGQAVAVAKVSDAAADRVAILRAVVAALDDPQNVTPDKWAKTTRQWATLALSQEAATDKRYSEFSSTILLRASNAAAKANVLDVEKVLAAAQRKDGEMGRRRPDVMHGLLAEIQVQLDAARNLRLARERWEERVGTFRAYLEAVTPIFKVLETAQQNLDEIMKLAGSQPAALVSLGARLQDSSRRLGAITVPDELKPSHALLQSALNLADNAVRTRRQAMTSGDLKSAWDASSSAAGSMMLFTRAREDLEAAVTLPHVR